MPKGPKKPLEPQKKSLQANVNAAAKAFDDAAGENPENSGKIPVKTGKKGAKGEEKPKMIPRPNAKKRLSQIHRSEKLRKPFLEDSDRYHRMYQGDYSRRGRGRKRDDRMSVNILYSHVEIITPAIFSGFPALKVRPKPKVGESTDQAELRARNMELVITYWFKELAADEILRRVFFDTFFGPACAEVGWETEIDDREDDFESEEGSVMPGPRVTTLKDRPFIIRREFRNLILDPDARSRRECRWIAIEEVMKWNDFQASSAFTEHAKRHVKPQLYPKSAEEKDQGDRPDDVSEKEWVQVYTIWDKESRRKYVVTEGYPRYLNSEDDEGEEWPYEMEYKDDPFPICIHDAKPDQSTPYSWSEFRAYEPQIKELNRLRQAEQIHVQAALPKYMYTEDLGDKATVNKLFQSRSDEGTKVNNMEAIKQVPVAEMPKDNHIMAVTAKEDLIEVSGLSEYQGAPNAETATEASIIEGRSKMRKTMRSRLWEQFVVEIGAKLAQLCQQNMDEEVAIQIAGPNGIEWLRVNKDQIQGEFFFDIEPGVMEYKNEALRMQQYLKFCELFGQDPNVNRRGLLSKGARMFDFSPEDVLLPVDQIPTPAPQPNIKFREIDPLAINDPALMNQFLLTAMRQNGVDVGQIVDQVTGAEEIGSGGMMQKLLLAVRQGKGMAPAGGAPGPAGAPPNLQALPGGAGKNMAGNGANPNGNPSLPPVVGNLNQGGNGQ